MASITVADIEMTLAGYAAIGERDLDAILEMVAPDSVLETRLETYSGHEGLRDYYDQAFISGFTTTQTAILVLEDQIAGLSTIQLDSPEMGLTAEDKVFELWGFESGKLKSLRVMNIRDGLEEFGLSERAKQVDRLLAGYAAFNRGDFDAVEAGLAPDVQFDRGEMAMDTRLVEGQEQVRQFLEPDVFQDQHVEIGSVVDADKKVMVEASFTARGSGSGIELTTPSLQVWTRRNDKVARAEFFQDRADALAFLLEPTE